MISEKHHLCLYSIIFVGTTFTSYCEDPHLILEGKVFSRHVDTV